MECVPLSLITKLLFASKQKNNGPNTSIPSPLLMRECSMSPSNDSTSIHVLFLGHSTYMRLCYTMTSEGSDIA